MRHGRPDKHELRATVTSYSATGPDKIGWRREHAHRVFAAIQAVAAVVSAHREGFVQRDSFAAYADYDWTGP